MVDFINEMYTLYGGKYNNLIDEVFNKFSDELEDIKNQSYNEINKQFKKNNITIKKQKTRWYKEYITDKDGRYCRELDFANETLSRLKQDNIDEEKIQESFKLILKAENIEELELKLHTEILEWKNDDKSYFADFGNFKSLDLIKPKMMTSAIKYDILHKLFEILQQEHKVNKGSITRVPSLIGAIGIDTSNRKALLDSEELNSIEYDFDMFDKIDKLLDTPEEKNSLILSLEKKMLLRIQNAKTAQDVITQIALIKAMKVLNSLDVAIINYFYTDLYNVVAGSSKVMKLRHLIIELGLEPTSKNYEDVENSLLKIGSVSLNASYDDIALRGSILGVLIENNIIKVRLGDCLRDLAIMDSSFNFDKVVYDNLSRDAQQIAVWLQNRRLKILSEKGIVIDRVTMFQIATAIMCQTSNITLLKRRIDKGFKELADNSLILKSFKKPRGSDSYQLEYVRLPQGIEEKIINKEIKSGELIEGAKFKTLELG